MGPELLAEPLREVQREHMWPDTPCSGSGVLWRGAGHRHCPWQPAAHTPAWRRAPCQHLANSLAMR